MKKTLFNIVIYSMLGWSTISAIYLALPIEYQAMIPEFNWLTAVISGGSTALLGTGALTVQTFLTKAKATTNETFTLLKNNYVEIVNEYKALKTELLVVKDALDYNNTLLLAELKAKLSNPLIDAEVKALIKQVIINDSQV